MKKKILIILGVLVTVLGLVVAVEATPRESSPGSASVKAVVTAARAGNDITYSITLVNESAKPAGNVYLAGNLPSGAKFKTAASAAAGSTQGGLDGSVVAWLVKEIPAKGSAGPFTYKVTADGGDVSAVRAWARWVSPSEGNTLSNAAVAQYQLAKMRSIAAADNEIYPDKQVAITLSKGYGYSDNNKIITSGLPNIGVGEFAYLQGAAKDASAVDVIAWSWELVQKPLGSKAALEGASTQKPRFRADSQGEYVVQVTVTNAKGAKSSSTIAVNAGRYAGSSLCVSCHDGSSAEDIASKFAQTNHSKKFEIQYGSYNATSDYCVKCHSVGFNEAADNGGLDEAAKAAGWNPANGSFLAWLAKSGKTIDDVKADSGMAAKINIQCENCHGPGGTSHTQAKTFEPGTCNQCHGQYTQWKQSGHAKVDDHMSGSSDCSKCHTSQGFIEVQIRGNAAVFPGSESAGSSANMLPIEQQSGITCVTCHDPHQATNPFKVGAKTKSLQLRVQGEVTAPQGWTADGEVSGICIKCHANKRDKAYLADFIAGKYTRGAHGNTQADVFYGQGIYDYNGALKTTNSAHTTLVTEGCVQCHMAASPIDNAGADGVAGNKDDVKVGTVGGHTFNVSGNWKFSSDPSKEVEVENTAGCKDCHGTIASFNIKAKGDYDGNGTIEGIQDEVKGLLAVLASKLPKDANGAVIESSKGTTEEQRKAVWNYSLVNNDGSLGVHNASFSVQLLQKTYKQLTGTDVPGATLR